MAPITVRNGDCRTENMIAAKCNTLPLFVLTKPLPSIKGDWKMEEEKKYMTIEEALKRLKDEAKKKRAQRAREAKRLKKERKELLARYEKKEEKNEDRKGKIKVWIQLFLWLVLPIIIAVICALGIIKFLKILLSTVIIGVIMVGIVWLGPRYSGSCSNSDEMYGSSSDLDDI